MRRRIFAGVILIATCHALFAQMRELALPPGNGAWLVQVVTSGGLSGAGGGDFSISSEGRIMCGPELRCPAGFDAAMFDPLFDSINPDMLVLPQPGTVPVVSLCSDCIARRVFITHRNRNGIVHTFTVSFDVTTRSSVPPELMRIYDAAIAATRPENALPGNRQPR